MTVPGDTESSRAGFWKNLSPLQSLVLTLLIPSLYLVGLLVAWFGPKEFGFGHRWLVWAGLTIGLAGLVIWILAMWQLGKSLAVLPGSDRLITRGLYRFLRHPIYVGIDCTLFGLFLAVGSVWGMAYLFLVVLPLNGFRARQEEAALLDRFGDAFRAWRDHTWF